MPRAAATGPRAHEAVRRPSLPSRPQLQPPTSLQRPMPDRVPSTAAAPPTRGRTRVVTLQHAEHQDSTLYRFDKGTVLRFCPGPSLIGRKVFLYTNYVSSDGAEFVRNQYYGLEWRRDDDGPSLGAGALLHDADVFCQLRLTRAGAYHFYFVYDTAECPLGPQGSGWFHVLPTLRTGGGELPLDAIMCQTVLAKCLGPLPRWESTLRVAKDAGYNMIHFTPVQELGASGSSYSIANQLKLNPRFADAAGRDATFADIENFVAKMRNEWNMLSICDVVLNHTANETAWLRAHPSAAYNCRDCAHLRPAAILDAALARLTAHVAHGRLAPRVPSTITAHEHIEALRDELSQRIVPALRLHELFQCDVDDVLNAFVQQARNKVPPPPCAAEGAPASPTLRLIPDPLRRRFRATVDMELCLRLFNTRLTAATDAAEDEPTRVRRCATQLRLALDELNAAAADEVDDHLRHAIDNCVAGMRYFRLQNDGPRIAEVSEKHPLVPRYFTFPCEVESMPAEEIESVIYGDDGALVMAHNGWVIDADPLQDFASAQHGLRVYLRRELIAWGDSVKLRYGDRPEDSPFLWAHMRDYVELTAEVFDGLRLDNCHSTPLHVAEYLLDCARNVKPELYVIAELFTNSDHVDHIFVNRLGITSLIREAQAAWDAHEQGRLVYRFGGRPVGAFLRGTAAAAPARPRVAHAMLLDLTHDNRCPLEARSVYDALPTAALVAMASCATGSTRGLDELVPHHVHVVDEQRLYATADDLPAGHGLAHARRLINRLHEDLARQGYCEVFVDQMSEDVVAVTRHDPTSRKSVIMVAATAFRNPEPSTEGYRVRPLRFEGQLETILFEAETRHVDEAGGQPFRPPGPFVKDPKIITGVKDVRVHVREAIALAQSRLFAGERRDGGVTELAWARHVPPGAVVALKVAPLPHHAEALQRLRDRLAAAPAPTSPLRLALRDLDLADLNAVLYRCEAEEREAGGGAYDVPGHGPLVYAGLQGVASLLAIVRPTDDLGHPLCANLRAGDWLADYVCRRLERDPRLRPLGAQVRALLAPLAELPRFLQPAYFEAVVSTVFGLCRDEALGRMAPWCREEALSRALALASVQLLGVVPSAPLPALGSPRAPSMSAGLPHFATGYMRCWGRDTFISLRGLTLLSGRAAEARDHILSYAACLRHGLIPNLLDRGVKARYNCRDAVWWWLYSIKQFVTEVSGGEALLDATVQRLFATDDAQAEEDPAKAVRQPLRDVMQEALDAHFQGRRFRERNAGADIDAHMTDEGFNVQIGVQPDTGFVYGGNDHNAGTWMDKMGSSHRAGNRGKPATPRDGSAVELVGLSYAVVAWLAHAHAKGLYPRDGVTRVHADGARTAWTWAQWAQRIRDSFERHFWVPQEPSAADARPDLVHRRAIYKDTHGATRPWADYQLRCNYVVAMAVAPDLFTPRRAWLALDAVEEHLLGPLGLKTLDPADWAYRPVYDNADDSDDPAVAHGYNYHQGPEWLWPLGFYLRARLLFAQHNGATQRTLAAVTRALGPLLAEAQTSPWRGLPELCDAGGAYCAHSCRSQAWSAATVMEVLHDLRAARRLLRHD